MGKKYPTAPSVFVRAAYLATFSVAMISFAAPGYAQGANEAEETPHENGQAMPGLVHMPLPVPSPALVTVAGTGYYGFIDPMSDLGGAGHRLQGQAAIALAPIPYFTVGMDVWGRMDLFSAADDNEANMYGEPRITARFQNSVSPDLYYGAELGVRLIGDEAPDVQAESISPTLLGLIGARVAPRTWLGGTLGFHLDNSDHALGDVERITPVDRITLGASSSYGIPFGIGVSHRLASETELLAELAGEVLVGSGAPSLFESPWGISFGARHPVLDTLSVMGAVDVSLSARGDLESDALVPVEPRFGGFVTLVWRPGHKPKTEVKVAVTNEPPREEKPKEELPPQVPTTPVAGAVVDEGGRPLADVVVVLKREGQPDVETRTYADGRYEFADVPDGPVELVIKTPGYDDVTIEFQEGEERKKEVVLYPSLPAGQVKGQIRDLKGNALPAAKIIVSPGDKEVPVAADGTFTVELAPGRYTVRFEHPELSPQKRVIRVQDRGVVILNIALSP